jgi:hypothetical protein
MFVRRYAVACLYSPARKQVPSQYFSLVQRANKKLLSRRPRWFPCRRCMRCLLAEEPVPQAGRTGRPV